MADNNYKLLPTKCADLSEHAIKKWEDLIDPRVDDVFLGAPMCSMFRLSVWRSYQLDLKASDHYSTLEEVYPHGVILAHTMMGRRAYYLGYPCVIAFYGAQDWLGYRPLIVTVILQELLDMYLSLGVHRQQIEKCRGLLLSYSRESLQLMLLGHNMPGREYFSLRKFLWRNRRQPKELIKLSAIIALTLMAQRLPSSVYRFLRKRRDSGESDV